MFSRISKSLIVFKQVIDPQQKYKIESLLLVACLVSVFWEVDSADRRSVLCAICECLYEYYSEVKMFQQVVSL